MKQSMFWEKSFQIMPVYIMSLLDILLNARNNDDDQTETDPALM